MNLMYADADGNIWYLYGSAVPRRDPSFAWREPVDGSDPRTEWGDYHPLADLPRWAQTLAQRYYTKTVSTFLLYGAVRDLQPVR